MMIAAQQDHKDVVKLSRKLGADVEAECEFDTAADLAGRLGHTAMA